MTKLDDCHQIRLNSNKVINFNIIVKRDFSNFNLLNNEISSIRRVHFKHEKLAASNIQNQDYKLSSSW